jgi:hypothetical protein
MISELAGTVTLVSASVAPDVLLFTPIFVTVIEDAAACVIPGPGNATDCA